jgi:hypothetical protein
MSRKDFRIIAQLLQDTRPVDPEVEHDAWLMWVTIRDGLAIDLKRAYRNFNVDQFEEWTQR